MEAHFVLINRGRLQLTPLGLCFFFFFLIVCLCAFGMEIKSETGMAVQEGSQVQAVPLPIQLPAGDLGKQ